MNNGFTIDNLRRLLGTNRGDSSFDDLLASSIGRPLITKDNDDNVDDEFIEFKNEGVSLCFEKGKLLSFSLYSSYNDQGFDPYSLPIFRGVQFDTSKDDVIKLLGKPLEYGGGNDGFFGFVPPWLKYKDNEDYVHYKFSDDSLLIKAITIMKL